MGQDRAMPVPVRLILSLIPLLSVGAVHAQVRDPREVVAAERAFAADSGPLGVAGSFNKWSAPTAVVIGREGATPVREAYPPDRPRDPGEPSLAWWPNFAGVARSGDLGFTTGAVERGGARAGHYFTVWRRQADGGWKWVYDGGSGATAVGVPGPDREPTSLPVAAVGAGSPERAMIEVPAAEAALARDARTDQAAAHLAALADDGRVYVAPRPPGIGRQAFAEALAGWPATFDFGPRAGGDASEAGDLAWTYGPAAWSADGRARRGHYVRIWQKRPEGWRIVLAQLIVAPPSAPPPAAG
jgi:ketosteroid isomerase-like protein